MHLTILNLTADNLLYQPLTAKSSDSIVLGPSLSATTILPELCSKLAITPLDANSVSKYKECAICPESPSIRVSLLLGASWRAIRVPDWCPWWIYLVQITSNHHRLTIFPRRNMASFLSEMPDKISLSSLSLPGTHDTMAFYGWPISQCQELSTPLAIQFQSGIRVIDIRLAIIKSRLIAYHGLYPQRTSFQEILSTVHTFLTTPSTSRETIVMSIKQEDFAKNSARDFSRLVHEEIFNGPGGRDMWFLENRIPSLGEVRGKVIMLSRFGGDGQGWEGGLEGLGIHPSTWPDSEKFGFSWQCKDTLVRTHDWYNIPSFLAIPEKVALATQILLPAPNNPPIPTLSISFLSAASFPLAFPPTVARGFGWPQIGLGVEGVNSRVTHWLLNLLSEGGDSSAIAEKGANNGPRVRGWTLLDFYADPEGGLVPLLVECNYRGRLTEESQ